MEVPKLTFTAFTKEEVIYEESQKPEPVSKLLLTIMPAMALVFAILYSITISKVRFYYKNTILKPIQENDCVIYSGKIEGQPTCFTVSEDKSRVSIWFNNVWTVFGKGRSDSCSP